MTEERFTEEELKRELKALKETGEETRQNYIRAHNERHELQQQNKQLIDTIQQIKLKVLVHGSDSLFDVHVLCEACLQQIQGVEES